MFDYDSSSQLNSWLFTEELLQKCRAKANQEARKSRISSALSSGNGGGGTKPPVRSLAAGYTKSVLSGKEDVTMKDDAEEPPTQTADGHPFLDPSEEQMLVDFYASKLPNLIGPLAHVPRLKRDVKVPATAALLFRRFFLSNSVMEHDPKVCMLAAAFLASKVEDATTDIRYLEEGTKLMNAPVSVSEILPAEVTLLEGINFDLMCFHPHKAVLAFTEDLRTHLKSDKGQLLVTFPSGMKRPVVGQDLKPMHDRARQLVDNDVLVSDIPLLYTPGQIGLAALMAANEELAEEQRQKPTSSEGSNEFPNIDLLGYVRQRFDGNANHGDFMKETMTELCRMLQGLKEGKYGCGNYTVDLQKLKGVHKKLKKCRSWGQSGKKSKKRKKEEGSEGPQKKQQKVE